VEISFVKRLVDNRKIGRDSNDLKEFKLSKWTYTQLRVLIISGGNKGFTDYMNQYDLMDENIQKRYNTVAAQYYRDYLRNKIKVSNLQSMLVQQPDYEAGR
jgi:hypothetical protein